jgi:hypothetical protein
MIFSSVTQKYSAMLYSITHKSRLLLPELIFTFSRPNMNCLFKSLPGIRQLITVSITQRAIYVSTKIMGYCIQETGNSRWQRCNTFDRFQSDFCRTSREPFIAAGVLNTTAGSFVVQNFMCDLSYAWYFRSRWPYPNQ